MSNIKLKNAPLKEVVFELHWNGILNDLGMAIDSEFGLAAGKFAQKLLPNFPVHKKLIPDGAPFHIFGAPLHQYWIGESIWPVVQHGQGIMAVNDVETNYEWENSYKPIVHKAIDNLIDSYNEIQNFNRLKLQYIDAWDIDDIDPRNFVSQNLLTELKFRFDEPGISKNFNIFQSFQLVDESEIQLSISNGINNLNQKQSVVWTTTIEKVSNFKKDEIFLWLENAHNKLSEMFKTMLNPDFYANFDK